MLYFPNAKINIGLNILSKRQDGYHEIESVFYPIQLKDVLEIIPSNSFEFSYSGVDNIEGTNLCEKAYDLLQKDYNFSPVKCHLHKIIPIGAGLGGGSADASFMLIALNNFFKLNISDTKLKEYALQIGSDCPFFIDNKPKYVTGRGENLVDIDLSLKGYHLVIINPNIHISTKEAYSGLFINHQKDVFLKETLLKSRIQDWKNLVKNDFEKSIFKNYPEIEAIKEKLYSKGAFYSSMSGTGSTVFGLFMTEVNLDEFPSNYFTFQTKL